MIRQAVALAFALVVTLVPSVRAQGCTGGQTFIKNDVLPASPGSQAVSVIQGLCENEACGAVFDVSGVGSTVKLKMAAIGFVSGGGANGATAAVNLIIYDGITWSGGNPTFGPEVFNFTNATGALIGVTSSAINTFDASQYNITISSGKLVMTWWMEINPNGDCPSGYTSNFATDYPTGGTNCNVHQKNLIFITGALPSENGWKDASTATVGFTQLCGNGYYAGNWLMRGCVEPAGPIVSFCPGDGSLATSCPCNNVGAGGQGCENSFSTGGAFLSATGTPVPDSVVLTSSGEHPTGLSIFWQATAENGTGVVWGDGLRCITGPLKRLYTKNASGGVASAPTGSDPSITTRSAALNAPIPPGATRYYQVNYRDGNPSFCTIAQGGSTFNSSNGLKITW